MDAAKVTSSKDKAIMPRQFFLLKAERKSGAKSEFFSHHLVLIDD